MSKSKSSEQQKDELNFEAALGELEALVEQLERGDLALSESLAQFERGVSLSRRCHSLLDDARQKVLLLNDPDHADTAVEFRQSDETSD
jgi:exodeoxyribonuclease VII small subunit